MQFEKAFERWEQARFHIEQRNANPDEYEYKCAHSGRTIMDMKMEILGERTLMLAHYAADTAQDIKGKVDALIYYLMDDLGDIENTLLLSIRDDLAKIVTSGDATTEIDKDEGDNRRPATA
jgi:hypothetical protein